MGKSVTATLIGVLVEQGAANGRSAGADPGMAAARRSARRHHRARPVADVERAAVLRPGRSAREIPNTALPDHLLHLRRSDRRVRVRDQPAGRVPAADGGALSQLRSACRSVSSSRTSSPTGCGENYLQWPQARAVRPHRRPAPGAGDRPVRQLHHERFRLRNGAQLGAARASLPAGRRVGGKARAARGLGAASWARRRPRGTRRATAASSG